MRSDDGRRQGRAWDKPGFVVHAFLRRMPRHGDLAVARRLSRRGDAARDEGRFLVAAALYEESLAVVPGRAAVHLQCGHMLKEGGAFAAAERHYLTAQALKPDDPEIALQLGHLRKMAGRPTEAAADYARALALRPGWTAAQDELARLPAAAGEAGDTWPVAELLPDAAADAAPPEGLTLLRLGRRSGPVRRLSGLEAVHGHLVVRADRVDLALLLDGAEIAHVTLAPALPATAAPAKFVFNLWHDFGPVAPGRHRLTLRFRTAGHPERLHHETVTIAPPEPAGAHPGSDALVPIDRASGVPAEAQAHAAPSMVRPARRTLLPDPVRTILVQRLDQLGDLVASVPALRRLRALFPQARLVGLLSPANAALGETLGLFDAVEVADFPEDARRARRFMDTAEQERLARRLRAHAPDLAIDLSEGSDSRPVLRLSGAPFLAGFGPRQFPWLAAAIEFHAPDPVNAAPAAAPARRLLALVEALAALRPGADPPLPAPDPAASGFAPGERYLMLHMGARLAYTRWPGFPALARLLVQHTALPVVVLADPDTPDLPAAGPRLRVMTGPLPFAQFDALVAGAAVFVGNDSGAKHLAALRGTPVVSLHMARLNWNEWGQEGQGLIVSRRVPCAGCGIGQRAEECGKGFACLHDIRAEEVLAAVLSLL